MSETRRWGNTHSLLFVSLKPTAPSRSVGRSVLARVPDIVLISHSAIVLEQKHDVELYETDVRVYVRYRQ